MAGANNNATTGEFLSEPIARLAIVGHNIREFNRIIARNAFEPLHRRLQDVLRILRTGHIGTNERSLQQAT